MRLERRLKARSAQSTSRQMWTRRTTLRPSSTMVAVYVMPFVLVGFLWIKLLLRRRHGRARA